MNYQIRPLTLNPDQLSGLSSRLITSHHENNYSGAVKRLNAIRSELAALDWSAAATFTINGLKREELIAANSAFLHELYFDALGGDGKSGGDVATALAETYGSREAWEAEFRRTAMALAGGSGWCVLSYNRHTSALRNYWAWDHMHGGADGAPLIALDMYEHSYHVDYGTQAARYVDAFMANLDWEVVDARYRAALA